MGSLAYGIIANTTDFKAGITATRQELKSLRSAFLDTQKPVERFSGAIQQLEVLMQKFPTRANEVRRSIHAIRREMDAARFAQGARNEAGFMADLDAGLARNRARDVAFRAAQIPGGGDGGGPTMLRHLINQSKVARSSLVALHGGSITPLIQALAATGPAGGLVGAATVAGAALASLAVMSIKAADAARQTREEFFKQVDAFKAAGGDTGFAENIKRVKSLATAWKEARDSLDGYLAAFAEKSGMHNPAIGFLTAASASFSTLRGFTEPPSAALDRELAERGKVRLAEETKALETRKARMQEFAELMERLAESERIAHDEKMRELKEHADRVGAVADKMRALFDETRTPAERLKTKLDEIMGLSALDAVDPTIRIRALRDLEDKAMGMLPGSEGKAHAKSIGGIRAGSVEALRAQFAGGTDKSERELKAAEKTAKETEAAKGLLTEIRDGIKSIGLAEAP